MGRMSALRSTLSALLILAGLAVAAFAAPATWARTHLMDTAEWTAALAPLIEEDVVRDRVSAAMVNAVNRSESLPDPAVRVLRRVADETVATDGFARVWEDAIRITHQQMVEGIRAEGTGIDVTDEAVAVELGPLVESLVPRLAEAGVPGVEKLPTPEGRIVLEDSQQTAQALRVAGVVDAWAWLSAALAAALLLGGVLLSRRPAVAVVLSGAGLVLVALVEGVAWRVVQGEVERAAAGSAGRVTVEALTGSVDGWLARFAAGGVVLFVLGLVVVGIGAATRGRRANAEQSRADQNRTDQTWAE